MNSGEIVLSLVQDGGGNGSGWEAGFIHSDVSNQSAANKIIAIRGMNGVHKYETEDIRLSISLSSIVNNKIIIGVHRDGNRLSVAQCTGNISATVVQKVTLTVAYNQGNGNIVAYSGSSYATPSAPATIYENEYSQITIAPLSPAIQNYSLTYNENQGI